MVSLAPVRHRSVALSLWLASACVACARLPPQAPVLRSERSADPLGTEPPVSAAVPAHSDNAALDDSGDSEHEGDDDEQLDDGELAEPAPGAPRPHPLDGWSEERI